MSGREGARRLKKLGNIYANYRLVDRTGDKVGSVVAAFIDETNQEVYLAVSMGPIGVIPGTGSKLVPLDICTVDGDRETVKVFADKDAVKESPSVDVSTTPSSEQASRVRRYYEVRRRYYA